MNSNDGKFYVFQKKEQPKPNKGKLALFLVISIVWLAGMVLMFTPLKKIGYVCWGVSFMAAFAVYLIQRHRDTLDEVREAEMVASAKDESESAEENAASAETEPAEEKKGE